MIRAKGSHAARSDPVPAATLPSTSAVTTSTLVRTGTISTMVATVQGKYRCEKMQRDET